MLNRDDNEKTKGDVTPDDSQRRFLAQHSSATWLVWLQHCSNISTLCCAKNRRCESLRVKTSSNHRSISAFEFS